MPHQVSAEDDVFLTRFEHLEIAAEAFDHAAHVRLAYIVLCKHPLESALVRMKNALLAYLEHLGLGTAKFHETITRAWIMAVHHFMTETSTCHSAAEFISRHPKLLDSRIMLRHYSAETLFSAQARAGFIEPDVAPIPVHHERAQ